MIAVEGELISRDGRLGGRVDLLLNEVDDAGETVAWVVADLKRDGRLRANSSRKLTVNFASTATFARQQSERTNVRAEGWYTLNRTTARVQGRCPRRRLCAWEATQPTEGRLIQPRSGQLRRILRLESVVRTLVALAP